MMVDRVDAVGRRRHAAQLGQRRRRPRVDTPRQRRRRGRRRVQALPVEVVVALQRRQEAVVAAGVGGESVGDATI